MASNPLHYIVTVNDINIGQFSSISEGTSAAHQAVGRGVAGYKLEPKVVEIRDLDLSYQVVAKFSL